MRKYLALFKAYLIQAFQYKAHGAIYTTFDLVPPLISIAYWNLAFSSQTVIGGYTKAGLLSYLIMTGVARSLLVSYPEGEMVKIINQGFLSQYLLKPLSFLLHQFIGEFAFKFNRSLFTFPALALLLFLSSHLTGSLPHLTLSPLVLLILVMSFLLNFIIKFIIGLSAIWTTEVSWLINLNELTFLIFSGSLLPLEFFPASIRAVFTYLPFEHLTYSPVKAVLGQLSPAILLRTALLEAIWLVALFFLYMYVWRKAVKHYEGYGN